MPIFKLKEKNKFGLYKVQNLKQSHRWLLRLRYFSIWRRVVWQILISTLEKHPT